MLGKCQQAKRKGSSYIPFTKSRYWSEWDGQGVRWKFVWIRDLVLGSGMAWDGKWGAVLWLHLKEFKPPSPRTERILHVPAYLLLY
jgi:hypothetical protein